MDLIVPNGKILSYFDLMDMHPKAFYYERPEVETWAWSGQLATPMPIRFEIIKTYENGPAQKIERSFPRDIGDVSSLPNIVEATAWWLTWMKIHGEHGMRSFRTPSSTLFGDRVICVLFMVNTHLATSLHDRRNSIMIEPDGTKRIIP
jgi:hypothetical protein